MWALRICAGPFVLKESAPFKTKTLRGVHTVRGTVVLDGPERSEESHCGGCEIVAYRDPPQAKNLASEILCSAGKRRRRLGHFLEF